MKKLVCLFMVLALLLCGCGAFLPTEFVKQPDPNIVPHRQIRYFAQEMEEEDYLNMCAYYEAAINFDDICDLPYPVNEQELEKLVMLIRYECPELIMLDTTEAFTFYTTNGMVTNVELPYAMTEQEYEEKLTKTQSVIDELVLQCQGLSDEEKEKLVYDHIVTNCIYDEYAQWAGSAYGCLVEGKAKCDGISMAMKWVMEEMDIPCMILAGDPPDGSVGHAWNTIRIDGRWYDLDVTADVSRDPEPVITYPAYNVSRTWIRQLYEVKTTIDSAETLPGVDDMSQSYHGLTGCYVPEGGEDRLEELYMAAYSEETSFVIQFESEEDFRSFEDTVSDRLDQVGRTNRLSSWSWEVYSIPDYRTVQITAGE